VSVHEETLTGKEGVISAFLTGFIFVALWLTACENLPIMKERHTVSFAQDALTKEQTEEFAKEIRWESRQKSLQRKSAGKAGSSGATCSKATKRKVFSQQTF